MASLDSDNHIRCTRGGCGFVVGDTYFTEKTRFTPGICPNCGGVVEVVVPFTTTRSLTHRLQVDPRERSFRRVVEVAV